MLIAFIKKHPDLSLSVAGVLAAFCILAAAETVLRLAGRPDGSGSIARTVFTPYPDVAEPVGYRPKPGMTLKGESKNDKQTFYTYEAVIDDMQRRATPCPGRSGKGPFALFFGCSFVFGDGLRDGETLPACFCARVPGVEAFNYAFSGHGVQQLWCHLQRPGFAGEISASPGLAFYVYIDHHLERLRGNIFWKQYMPRLEVEGGKVVYKGLFHPLTGVEKFWAGVDALKLGRLFHNEFFPLPPAGGKEAEKLALICADARQQMTELFPGSDLRVIIFPKQKTGKMVSDALSGHGVACMDYSGLLDGRGIPDEQVYFPDGHPRPATIQLLCGQLVSDLAADPEWGPKLGLTPAAAP